jgi:hypothetical protein
MKGFGVAFALGCWLCTTQAAAQAPTPFQLSYGTHPGCPTASEFAARISAHTPIARPAAAGERALELRVTTAGSERGAHGKLVIVALDGSSSERTVEGRDCREVVDALALVAAIVIDPNAQRVVAEPPATAVAESAPAAAAAGQTAATTVPPPERKPAPPPPAPAPAAAPPAPAAPPDASDNQPWQAGPSFQAGLVGEGLTPNGGVALLYGIEVVLEREELFAPSLRLSGYNVLGNEVTTAIGKARFDWTLARVSLCPLRWSVAFLAIRPCALVDVGRLHSEGYDTSRPEEHASFWAALGAAARAEVRPHRILAIEVELGASFPLSNERFFFDPAVDAYEVNPGVYGLVGIGLRFP